MTQTGLVTTNGTPDPCKQISNFVNFWIEEKYFFEENKLGFTGELQVFYFLILGFVFHLFPRIHVLSILSSQQQQQQSLIPLGKVGYINHTMSHSTLLKAKSSKIVFTMKSLLITSSNVLFGLPILLFSGLKHAIYSSHWCYQ